MWIGGRRGKTWGVEQVLSVRMRIYNEVYTIQLFGDVMIANRYQFRSQFSCFRELSVNY